jgi:mono/diheme cytochrome c family protein
MARIGTIAAAGLAMAAAAGAVSAAIMLGPGHAERPPFGPTPVPIFLTQPIADSVPNADQVRRGQYLVRVGDCAACHTRDGAPPLSGGFGLNTPFGVIYSTNLTSDRATGVGDLTPDQFYAALHEGVGPKGQPIYPAMPYTAFTRVSRADSDAILAFLKTTPAVSYLRPHNRLMFPLNFRILVRGWNLLFFRPGAYLAEPAKSDDWNRGAYLVNGLGHCGACHTPKTFLASDKAGQALQGGNLDNWVAPDLTGNARTGLGGWSVDDILEYLKTGRNGRANAGGPMAQVVSESTSLMSDADLRAMAVYLKDQPASPSREPRPVDIGAMTRGAAVFSDACASCHLADGRGQPRYFPPLTGDAAVQQADPASLTHMILAGVRTGPTASRPTPLSMPSFAWKLTDQQIADVATFTRNSWGNHAPPVSAGAVAKMRKRLGLATSHLTDNSGDHS